MRLFRLLALGFIGYTAYQFFKGMSGPMDGGGGGGGDDRAGRGNGSPAGRADQQRQAIGTSDTPEGYEPRPPRQQPRSTTAGTASAGGLITDADPGSSGQPVETYDNGGTSVRHKVGRGVISGP